MMTYVYDKGMREFRLGESTAASFMVTVVGLLTLGFLRKAMNVDDVETS